MNLPCKNPFNCSVDDVKVIFNKMIKLIDGYCIICPDGNDVTCDICHVRKMVDYYEYKIKEGNPCTNQQAKESAT
jgi:hypothetical protein